MVLEDASSSSEPSSTSFSETAPTSDIDPYASGNANPPYSTTRDSQYMTIIQPNSPPIYINYNNVPQPITGTGPRYRRALEQSITQEANVLAQLLRRPAKQDEAEAVAFYYGKTLRIASYGSTSGAVLAAARVYATRHQNYRFPGWTPMKEGGRFSPDVFGPLRGQYARSAWGVARSASYLTVGILMGQLFFGFYGISVGVVGRSMDPRLKEFTDAVKERAKSRRGELRPEQEMQGGGPRAGETNEMARQRRNVQRQVPSQGRREQVDDMSPTGGAFQQDLEHNQTDSGLMDDSQVRSYDYSRQREQVRAAVDETSAATRSSSQQQSQRRASPPSSEQSSSSSSGSSWDRLRKNAMTGGQSGNSSSSGSRSSNSSKNSPSGGDSFSFSQRDEDQQLAKSEAQRDFDARMDRERAGKDFDQGRGWK